MADDGREGRRLAGAGRARDEDEATRFVRQPLDPGWEAELGEGRDGRRDGAEGERRCASLPEGVHAEARQPLALIGDVELARLVEGLETRGRRSRDRLERGLERARVERRPLVEPRELAVAPDHRRLAELEVHVARAELDGVPEEGVQIHALHVGAGRDAL